MGLFEEKCRDIMVAFQPHPSSGMEGMIADIEAEITHGFRLKGRVQKTGEAVRLLALECTPINTGASQKELTDLLFSFWEEVRDQRGLSAYQILGRASALHLQGITVIGKYYYTIEVLVRLTSP